MNPVLSSDATLSSHTNTHFGEHFAHVFDGASVLITGGMGFIGSNLARRLVGLNAHVTLVDSLIPEYGGNSFNIAGIEDHVHVNIADVRDEHAMRYLVRGHDFLFNLAGQTSHMDSMQDPYTDLEINSRAQLSILEACRKENPAIRIVFASTRQVYGKPDSLPVNENHPLRPVDVNGINKLAGEWYHILYNNVYGVRACALRLTNTYGPRMRVVDARQTFLGVWVRLLVEGKPFDVWGGEQLRDFTYVDDAVEAFLAAAACEEASDHREPVWGKIYNIGGQGGAEGVVTLRELAALLLEANGGGAWNLRSFPADRKRIDIGDYYTDDRAFRSALGWEALVPLRDGLARTLEYYREHLAHYV